MDIDAVDVHATREGTQPMETDSPIESNPGIAVAVQDTPMHELQEQINAQISGETNSALNIEGKQIAENTAEMNHENLSTLAAISTDNRSNIGNIVSGDSSKSNASVNVKKLHENDEMEKPGCASPSLSSTSKPIMDEEEIKWHTVGIFQGLSTTVNSYIPNSEWSSYGINLKSDNLPDLSNYQSINLEPGTAYRFRIRAINTVGASDWSEISSFKTCQPGFPGAPSAIKISKSLEGAHLTWEPPPSCANFDEIIEYSVYLAVKPGKEKEAKSVQRSPAQLVFVRVYVGSVNQCTVSHTSLSTAHVDCSSKPAIIFRIAARNEKGYGPATQVRWLQDPVQASTSIGQNSLLSPTRIKPELNGASPNKRFKGNTSGGINSSNASRLMLPPGMDN